MIILGCFISLNICTSLWTELIEIESSYSSLFRLFNGISFNAYFVPYFSHCYTAPNAPVAKSSCILKPSINLDDVTPKLLIICFFILF